MGGEMHALLRDSAKSRKREYLKAAAVREHRPIPVKKFMDAAHIVNDVVPRTHMQMIGVGKLHLTADLVEVLRGNAALDGSGCSDIHKNGGLYRAVNGFKGAAARVPLLL